MTWSGVELNSQMQLPTVQLTLPDMDGSVEDYLETINMLGRDVTLQMLHLDLLADPTNVDEVRLQVMAVGSGEDIVTFTLGLNFGLSDQLPKDIISLSEFPSVYRAGLRKASIREDLMTITVDHLLGIPWREGGMTPETGCVAMA